VSTTPGRCTDPAWQACALARVDDGSGEGRTGWSQPRVRPWSTVLRIERGRGEPWWLKPNGDGTRHQASLLDGIADVGSPARPSPCASTASGASPPCPTAARPPARRPAA